MPEAAVGAVDVIEHVDDRAAGGFELAIGDEEADAGPDGSPVGGLDAAHDDPVVTWAGALVGVGVAVAWRLDDVVVVVVVVVVDPLGSVPVSLVVVPEPAEATCACCVPE
jgi:hypothetical protein